MHDLLPRSALLALALLALAACQDRERCDPGDEVECECEDGEEGTRYCLPNRSYDACYCWSSGPWPNPGLEPSPTSFDAAARDASTGEPDDGGAEEVSSNGFRLASGSGTLLDVFAAGTDVWVVEPAGITRISLEDGSEQARWAAPRPLALALLAGERLVVFDGAQLTLLEKDALGPGESLNLVEPCKFAALLSESLVACTTGTVSGPLYVFDIADAVRQSFVVNSLRSQRVIAVPGTQRFLLSDDSSTLLVQVVELDGDGGAPARFDGRVTIPSSSISLAPPLAFDGVPAENLVNRQGILLRMNGSCGTSSEPCLARTGTLGLLQERETFLGLDTVGGELFGLIDGHAQSSSVSGRCSVQPCRLVRIDVAARELRAELLFRRSLPGVIALRALPEQHVTVLGLGPQVSANTINPVARDAGFEVVRVDWLEEQ